MISRVLPYPLLTVSLIIFWMTINSFSAGHLLLGTGVALIASGLWRRSGRQNRASATGTSSSS